jgi:hypothetical protein
MLVVFAIMFESFLEWLEHVLHEKEHYLAMMWRVFKELMILGTISATQLVLGTSGALEGLPSEWLISFEFSHVLLFCIALFYALQAVCLAFAVAQSQNHWRTLDDLRTKDIIHLVHNASSGRFGTMRLYLSRVCTLAEFFLIKHLFIRSHGLPASFNFATYVQRNMQFRVKEQLEISIGTWLVLLIMVSVASLVGKYQAFNLDEGVDVIVFCSFGLALLLMELTLQHFANRAIHRVLETTILGEPWNLKRLCLQLVQLSGWVQGTEPLRKRECSTIRGKSRRQRDASTTARSSFSSFWTGLKHGGGHQNAKVTPTEGETGGDAAEKQKVDLKGRKRKFCCTFWPWARVAEADTKLRESALNPFKKQLSRILRHVDTQRYHNYDVVS